MAKLLSSFLSLLIFLSSSGVTYAQHFCGGHEVMSKVTIGQKHMDCGMDMPEGGCCDNEFTKVDVDDSHPPITFDFNFDSDLDFDFLQYVAQFPLDIVLLRNEFYGNYSPPPLEIELYLLHESFLI